MEPLEPTSTLEEIEMKPLAMVPFCGWTIVGYFWIIRPGDYHTHFEVLCVLET